MVWTVSSEGKTMSLITLIAFLFLAAFVLSIVLSLMGLVLVGALKLLPIVFIVLAVLFFVKGGKLHIQWPGKHDDGPIDVDAHPHDE